jgi:hypothetical protein
LHPLQHAGLIPALDGTTRMLYIGTPGGIGGAGKSNFAFSLAARSSIQSKFVTFCPNLLSVDPSK